MLVFWSLFFPEFQSKKIKFGSYLLSSPSCILSLSFETHLGCNNAKHQIEFSKFDMQPITTECCVWKND